MAKIVTKNPGTVLPFSVQFNRGYKAPLDLHSTFKTLALAEAYLASYAEINVYDGQLISVGENDDVKLYIVKSTVSGDNITYRLEETGGSVKKVATAEDITAFATADNIGKQFYLTAAITSGEGENIKVEQTVGLYVVTGDNTYQKLAVSPASGDLASDVADLSGKVSSLQTTVGDSTKGLVKNVAALQNTVGDSTKGLVKDLADLNSAAVKSVVVKTTDGDTTVSSSGIATIDLSNYATKTEISSVYKAKGTKATIADLPLVDNVVGDVWNIAAAFEMDGKKYPAGTNVVYTGTEWDPLGGELDLSNYFTQEQVNAAIETSVGKLDTLTTTNKGNVVAAINEVKGSIKTYTHEESATQVQVNVDDANVISATLVTGAVVTDSIADKNITKAKLSDAIQTSLGKADAAAPQATTYTKTEVNALLEWEEVE
jgi:hypothetical protein